LGLLQGAAILLLAVLAPACGGKGKSKPPVPGSLGVTLTTPAGVQKGVVSLDYTLVDQASLTCTIAVEYSTNGGGSWLPATPAPGGDGRSDLGSSPGGVAHVFKWNSLADGVAVGSQDNNVRFRITPADTVPGTPSSTSNFAVDNSANTAPSLTITTPAGVQSGLVLVSYSLADAQSDPCLLQTSFSTDGGTVFSPATPGPGGEGVSGLASTPGGTAHTFLWNSVADGVALGGANATVQMRLQPSDGTLGGAQQTADFSVDNSGKSSGSSLSGYPLQFNGSSFSDWATSAATDGVNLYVFGFEQFDFEASSPNSSWHLRKRLIRTGAAVTAFGTLGTVSGNPGAGLDIPFKVVVSGGSLYLLMASESGAGSRNFSLRVEKRRADDGALVAAFGTGGVLTATPGAAMYDGIPLPWTMGVDGSFLYLAGSHQVSSTDSQWRIQKRDKTTGQLISTFGTNGVVDNNPSSKADGCFAMVIGATSMWLVGAEDVDGTAASNGRIRIEKRKLLDGTLETGFGSGGVVIVDAGTGDDLGEDAVSDGTSLFVFSRVESTVDPGMFQARIEKLDLTTGAQGAVVTGSASDPSGELPFGHLALDGGNLYVCRADGSPDTQWLLEKRSTSDLSLVSSFGTAGVVQINPAVSGYDRPLGIVAAGGVILLSGMDSFASDEQWHLEARWR
jgi:hypothetical protein